jgi:hypothetical protein
VVADDGELGQQLAAVQVCAAHKHDVRPVLQDEVADAGRVARLVAPEQACSHNLQSHARNRPCACRLYQGTHSKFSWNCLSVHAGSGCIDLGNILCALLPHHSTQLVTANQAAMSWAAR